MTKTATTAQTIKTLTRDIAAHPQCALDTANLIIALDDLYVDDIVKARTLDHLLFLMGAKMTDHLEDLNPDDAACDLVHDARELLAHDEARRTSENTRK